MLYPLNEYQKEILNVCRFYEGTPVANIGGVMTLDGVEDTDERLLILLRLVTKKADALRLRLSKDEMLYDVPADEDAVRHVKLSGGRDEAFAYARECMETPFPGLYDIRLFDLALICYDGGRLILFKLHHLIGDAAAIALLCKQYEKFYLAGEGNEEEELFIVPTVYGSMNDGQKIKAGEYFEKKLPELSKGAAKATSPDCSAQRISFKTDITNRHITAEFLTALFMYLSGSQLSSSPALGFVLGNRRKEEFSMVGMFANTLPLVMPEISGSFEEYCKKTGAQIMQLLRFSRFCTEDMKNTLGISSNLYDISVSYRYNEFIPTCSIGEIIEITNGCSQFPMRISAVEYEDGFVFDIDYQTAVYSAEEIRSLGGAVVNILKQIMSGVSPEKTELISDEDKELYRRLNDTGMELRYKDLNDCFRCHISDKEALVWEGGALTGRQLYHRAAVIGAHFSSLQAGRIGLKMERCHEMIEAALGILLAGKCFMVVSDRIPGLEQYVDITVDREYIAGIRETEYAALDAGSINTADTASAANTANTADTADTGIKSTPAAPDDIPQDADAYMVCTSGSTGKPKCIAISRRSLLTRLEWADREYGLGRSILQKTVNTFDVSIWEMLSVIYGARLYLCGPGDEKRPDRIADAIIKQNITLVHFVPSMLQVFLEYTAAKKISLPSIETVITSGEKLSVHLAERFAQLLPEADLYNHYGPAECTIDVTSVLCGGDMTKDIPIGRPVGNTQIAVISKDGKVLPAGTQGEICIFGDLVGKGYVTQSVALSGSGDRNNDSRNDENRYEESRVEKSRKRDAGNGYCIIDGKKAYRTGDLGKLGFDGQLYIAGRMDRQIKLRGMRIDLSAVKEAVEDTEGVKAAHIAADGHRLICFYVSDEDVDIMEALTGSLPSYAVPTHYCRVDEIPLTTSGKADERALVAAFSNDCGDGIDEGIESGESSGDTREEQKLLAEVGRYVNAGADDDIFDAGLDSISLIELVLRLREQGIAIDLGDFYEKRTVRRIARDLGKKEYYTYLGKNDSDTLLVFFPYAGGGPQDYSKLAGLIPCDSIGVYISAFDKKETTDGMVKKLLKVLPLEGYDRIIVFGQCASSVAAAVFAQDLGEKCAALILAAPAVGDKVSPWHLMSDKAIGRILKAAGADKRLSGASMLHFRNETDRYFSFRPKGRLELAKECRVAVVFGKKDPFTADERGISRRLKHLLGKEIAFYAIPDGKHYINDTHADRLARIVRKVTGEQYSQ